jgi:hypothetical protein
LPGGEGGSCSGGVHSDNTGNHYSKLCWKKEASKEYGQPSKENGQEGEEASERVSEGMEGVLSVEVPGKDGCPDVENHARNLIRV